MQAGDAMPAARAMMQAEASMTGRAVPFDSVAGKVSLLLWVCRLTKHNAQRSMFETV